MIGIHNVIHEEKVRPEFGLTGFALQAYCGGDKRAVPGVNPPGRCVAHYQHMHWSYPER